MLLVLDLFKLEFIVSRFEKFYLLLSKIGFIYFFKEWKFYFHHFSLGLILEG